MRCAIDPRQLPSNDRRRTHREHFFVQVHMKTIRRMDKLDRAELRYFAFNNRENVTTDQHLILRACNALEWQETQ